MPKEIIFETINRTTPTLSLEATYKDTTGETKTLLKNGQIVAGTLDPKLLSERDDKRIGKDRELRFIVQTKEDAVRVDFWSRHTGALVPGPNGVNKNPNCKKPLFVLRDKEVEGRVKTSERKLRGRVWNMVNNTDEHSQYNLAVAVGINPIGLSEDEIYNKVCDYAERNPLDFLKLLKRSDLERLIIVKKAIALGVIEKNGEIYMHGEVPIGASEEQVFSHFEHNEEQYKAVRRQVAYNDNLPVDFKGKQDQMGVISIQELANLDEVIHEAEAEQERLGQLSETGAPKSGPGRKKGTTK